MRAVHIKWLCGRKVCFTNQKRQLLVTWLTVLWRDLVNKKKINWFLHSLLHFICRKLVVFVLNQADALCVTIRVPSILLLWYFKKLPDLALLFWFFFQRKAFLKAILYLGDLAIQLTFVRLLCRGSHRVLPCEQRPFISIFRGVAKSLYY